MFQKDSEIQVYYKMPFLFLNHTTKSSNSATWKDVLIMKLTKDSYYEVILTVDVVYFETWCLNMICRCQQTLLFQLKN